MFKGISKLFVCCELQMHFWKLHDKNVGIAIGINIVRKELLYDEIFGTIGFVFWLKEFFNMIILIKTGKLLYNTKNDYPESAKKWILRCFYMAFMAFRRKWKAFKASTKSICFSRPSALVILTLIPFLPRKLLYLFCIYFLIMTSYLIKHCGLVTECDLRRLEGDHLCNLTKN